MDEFWKLIAGCLRILLVADINRPPLNYARAIACAAAGGLIGGFFDVGLIGWLRPEFTHFTKPLDAAARVLFGALFFGMMGAVTMTFLSGKLHTSNKRLNRLAISTFMAILGASILVAAHFAGAETPVAGPQNKEWLALAIQGATGSAAVINLVNFTAIPNGIRCITVSLLSSLISALGYASVCFVGLFLGTQFAWNRGLFITIEAFFYFECILFTLFAARFGEGRFRSALGKSQADK